MLDIESCSLVVIDIQGKLAMLSYDREVLFKNIQILIKSAKLLDIPVLWSQQCPDALGPTVPHLAELLSGIQPIDKASFSCCGDKQFISKLSSINRPQVLLCGIETHVCIYQTAVDLQEKGCAVFVIADAVSSRTLDNKQIALTRMQAIGINIYSAEMALFELLKTADHPQFKQIAKLVK
jgi:nicotinamidase-related amidase